MSEAKVILACSIENAAKISGIGKTKLYELIGDNKIVARKFGRRTLVSYESLQSWMNSLPSINE
jgi:excisionase family DNA binding protein